MPWDRANAIEITLHWGGLAEIPHEHKHLSVRTEGSMFTRTFFVEFELPPEALHKWIASSKRLRNHTPDMKTDGTALYEIDPGEGGAIGGTVQIDFQKGEVQIKMAWS